MRINGSFEAKVGDILTGSPISEVKLLDAEHMVDHWRIQQACSGKEKFMRHWLRSAMSIISTLE